MKKVKKIFSLLLCSFLVCLTVGEWKNGERATVSVTAETEAVEKNGYVTIESFESYSTVSRIHCDSEIGDGKVTKDYQSEGNASFQVKVANPNVAEGALDSTFMYVPTYGNVGKYVDFSMIDEIALDVYGVSGTELKVGIAAAIKTKTVTTNPVQTYEVKNGEWTTIYCPVNRTVTAAMMNIEKVSEIQITLSGKDAVVCVDNLRLHKASSEYVEANITVEKDEFCDFEKAYQSFMTVAQEAGGKTPTTRIITDPEKASNGSRFLQIHSPEMASNPYFYLSFSSKLFQASKFNDYSVETGYLIFDVYKDFEERWKFTLRLLNSSASYKNMTVRVPEGAGWHTVCVPLKNKVNSTDKMQFVWRAQESFPNGVGGYDIGIDNMRLVNTLPKIKGSVYVVEVK